MSNTIESRLLALNFIPKVVLFAASCRQTSINRKLVYAVQQIVQSKGVEAKVIDLQDYPMPLFCGDMEVPEGAKALVKELSNHDAVFIATPELNGSIPPILKNVIDWTSLLGFEHFTQPVYGLGAASPGPMSGIMAMQHLNNILSRLGATVIPVHVGTGNAKSAFDSQGHLIANPSIELAQMMADQLIMRVIERKASG